MAFDISTFLKVEKLSFGNVKVEAVDADKGAAAFGEITDESAFTLALDKTLNGAESIGDVDDISAEGYYAVLGAAVKHPVYKRMPASLIGRSAVQMARMQNVMRVGTERQAKETLRPNVTLVMEFNMTGPFPQTATVRQRPNIPGVPTSYKDAPLALRQTPIFLISGSPANAKIVFLVAEIPSVKLTAPDLAPPPTGTSILRYMPASYQAGLAPPALRDTDEITLQTEFACVVTATGPVAFQVLWEFRSDMAFGAGTRCISSRGASAVRGPARIVMH